MPWGERVSHCLVPREEGVNSQMLESLIEAMGNFGRWDLLLAMVAGTAVGNIFGIMPGLSGTTAMIVMLPLVFVLKTDVALFLLLSAHTVSNTGGSLTSILANIPGTAGCAPTCIDGFPMTQKGEAGRAIGAALMSSGVGGVIGALLGLVGIPIVLVIIMALTSSDMVFIILLGLSFIVVLGKGSIVKGLIGGFLGMVLSLFGYQALTGVERFTFGSLYLYSGISLVAVCLGMFALPEAIVVAASGGTIAPPETEAKGIHGLWQGMVDVFRHWSLFLRATIIGWIIGVIPGIGGDVAAFVTYGQAKQTSKHPELFGTGIVEGVIAPESSNNSKEGGALLTTLALGIPGSTGMAILLAALLMLGITPGPTMLKEHLSLSVSLMLVVVFSNIIAVFFCLPIIRPLLKVVSVPSRILFPMIVIVVFVGCFARVGDHKDLLVMLAFSVLGLAFRKYDYSRPAFVLGFILGNMFEGYLFMALGLDGPLFFLRPISLGILLFTIVFTISVPLVNLFKRRSKSKRGGI